MPTDRPTVVVVGAGLAGLTCAWRLAPYVDVVLLEARARVGGRCWSSRGWVDDQVAEHGGELIESHQAHVLDLIDQLGLELESRQPPQPVGMAYTLNGRRIDFKNVKGLPTVLLALAKDLEGVTSVSADTSDAQVRRLDEMTACEWLDERIDGGTKSLLGAAVSNAVRVSLGFTASELSALSLHDMFVGLPDPSAQEADTLDENPDADGPDEQPEGFELADAARLRLTHTFHVKGGNDLIATGLADRLPHNVLTLQAPVTAIRRVPDGTYAVTTTGSPSPVIAHRVVVSNPLPTLRAVDLTDSGLSPRRHDAIEQMGMGVGTKVLLQMDAHPDTIDAWPGLGFSDNPAVTAWDSSAGQSGKAGLVTLFGQGPLPATVDGGHGPLPTEIREQSEQVLTDISPDLVSHLRPGGWVDDWAADPWSMGSYAGYGPGQYTRFRDLLAQPENGIHFAGEHTSLTSPGYLDGAIESGYRAADEVLKGLGITSLTAAN